MYVIYINDRPLVLRSSTLPRTSVSAKLAPYSVGDGPGKLRSEEVSPATHLTANYSGKPRTLLQYADMLEKGSPKVLSVDIVSDDLAQLWADFCSKYKWVPAAGGLVLNPDLGQYLFIFRRNSWDLPKGKIDEGEDAPTAALREVNEETGVADLVLGAQLPTTYHTYRNRKGKRVLKPTYWFCMQTNQQNLVPQAEEDIEKAIWASIDNILANGEPLYASLRHLLQDQIS